MEVEPEPEQVFQVPLYINYFDVSNNFPWRETRPEQIERRRALLGDTLIFDLLLSSGGTKQPDALYPPIDVSSLQQLLDAIQSSDYDTLKKECLVYYLLKWHQDGREERFQLDRCIPPQFAALADAYWLLDTGVNVPLAVSFLSDARINQDYVSKVLQAISLAPNPSMLIVKYVRTARPALTEPRDLELYIVAMAESCGLCDAWEFQRTFNQAGALRPRLIKKLLEWSATPKPKSAALKQLLFLPLSPFEETHLHTFALGSTSISPTAMAAFQDLICVRLIQAGRYAEAIKMNHEFAASTSSLLKGLTMERTKMIQEIYATLPSSERLLLDEELKQANKPSPPSVQNIPANKSGDISMSSSWEDVQHIIRSPSPKRGKLAPLRTLQLSPISIPERSQTLRFDDPLPKKSLADIQLPLIPTSSAPTAPKPTSRKSFPLPFVSASNTTSKPPRKPRHSAGYVPTITKLDTPGTFPPSFASKKVSVEPKPPAVNGSATGGFAFSSASKSKNAFYRPPSGREETEATPREGDATEPEVPPAGPSSVGADTEMVDGDVEQEQEKSGSTKNQPELHFSIFGNDTTGPSVVSNGFYDSSVNRRKKRKNVPPGAFLSDEEDGMEDDQDHEGETWGTTISSQIAPSGTRQSQPPPVSENKPAPGAEKKSTKSRTSTTREVQQLKRSLPGALMDEEDGEEDHVAPLRQPSPPRRLRKGRSSTSSDLGDEPSEAARQTRRRSSRLSNHVHVTSPETSPKKPSTSARTRKSTRSSASSTKKR